MSSLTDFRRHRLPHAAKDKQFFFAGKIFHEIMIYDLDSKKYLAHHPKWALGWFGRLRGMTARHIATGEFDAIVFPRCSVIYSLWLTGGIDLLFLNQDSIVIHLEKSFRPWRLRAGYRDSATIIALPPGKIEKAACRVGHRINLNSTLDSETIEKLQSETMLNNAAVSPCSTQQLTAGTKTNESF